MRKILFTDLDGTLLNDESMVAEEMKKALEAMCKAGHVLALSSGRPLDSILEVKKKAGIDFPGMYIIANNGTLIYECDTQKNILEKRVSYEDVVRLFQLAEENKIHIQTYTDTHIVTATEDEEIQYYRRKIHLPLLLTENPLEALHKEPFKLLCVELHNYERISAFRDTLQQRYGDHLQTVFSNRNYLEIFSKEAGKGNGLRYLCEYLNIPVENSIAAGDAQNDISMLEAAGLSVAMCNGEEAVKDFADVVTKKSNEECGLADIIREYM